MRSLSTADLLRDPDLLTRQLRAGDGTPFAARLLRSDDDDALGVYFDGLSEATRGVYGPHPFSSDHARLLCAEIDRTSLLTFLAIVDDEVTAYFLLQLGVRDGDRKRYAEHGPPLVDDDTCTFAPSVADAFQERGVGSAMMPLVLGTARQLGRRCIVLWGGVRGDNPRARHFYEKFGFRHVGHFSAGGLDNHDMILDL